ncbi:MAG: hypothetical protein LBV75_08810 [Paludibacter sp.]|jgi:uncharacterized protein YgbK (DUF1537 family)|nr:hypothetical protein [Paludibacter sp.]
MLIILADDLTGAAEIAGVCLRYGLQPHFEFERAAKIKYAISAKYETPDFEKNEVLIIATNIRTTADYSAISAISEFIAKQVDIQLFVKIDSLIRGDILSIIQAITQIIPKDKIFILPANPETGRVISNGDYCINGVKIENTPFANEFNLSRRTSNVREIITFGHSASSVCEKLVLPDLLSNDDYFTNANLLSKNDLAVGGSVFFEAYLRTIFQNLKQVETSKSQLYNKKVLMLCGSYSSQSRDFVVNTTDFYKQIIPHADIALLLNDKEKMQIFTDEIAEKIKKNNRLLVAIEQREQHFGSATTIEKLFATICKNLLARQFIDHLFIEGGSTAYACLAECEIDTLLPEYEHSRGVVQFRVPQYRDLHITLKPGSYRWDVNLFADAG